MKRNRLNNRKNFVVTVFGSSVPQPGTREYETAYKIGKLLALSGFIVCNSGYGGTMEASARGSYDAGGRSIGVVARHFSRTPNAYVGKLIKVAGFVDRLFKLINLGDAYIVLKGGTGTLVELSLVWELMNKSVMIGKPIIPAGKFWSPVVGTLKNELRFKSNGSVAAFISNARTPEDCIKILKNKIPVNRNILLK